MFLGTFTFTADFRNVTDLETLQVTAGNVGDTLNLLRLDAGTTVKFASAFATANLTADTGTSTAIEVNGNIGTLTLDATTESLSIKGYTGGTVFTTISGTSLADITVTGDQAITLGTLPTTVTKIDGSDMTGALTATLTSTTDGNTLLGGSAGDTLTGSAKNDVINGGAGADTINLTAGGKNTVLIDSQADSRAAGFAGTDANYSNVDTITAFDGTGASTGDSFQLSTVADAYGANLDFTTSTNVTVTKITLGDTGLANIDAVMAAAQAATAGTASTNATAQVYQIDVAAQTGGIGASKLFVLNDSTATLDSSDTIVDLQTLGTDLHTSDFVFV